MTHQHQPRPLPIGEPLRLAVEQAMNAAGRPAGCPPIDWAFVDRWLDIRSAVVVVRDLLSGMADTLGDAERWAAALGMEPAGDADVTPGTATWRGRVDGYELRVWCVTDRAAFEAACRPVKVRSDPPDTAAAAAPVSDVDGVA